MSAHEEEATEEMAIDLNERIDKNNASFSPDMIEENIKANLKPLHAQISALTETIASLIQGNSARIFTTSGTRKLRFESESLFTEAPGTSRFPPVAPLTTAGYSPDNGNHTINHDDHVKKHGCHVVIMA